MNNTDTERAAFEAVFGPMPWGCTWTGKGYCCTEFNAWAASSYSDKFEGWKAARRAPSAAPACLTCNGHGVIGNIFDHESCPDCNAPVELPGTERGALRLMTALCEDIEAKNMGDNDFERGMRTAAKRLRIEMHSQAEPQPPEAALEVEQGLYKKALYEWLDKTEWVQNTATISEIGKHRADILRERIEALQAEVKHWRSNHDNVAARLRIFTQRPDLPENLVSRLPWYMELVRLQEMEAGVRVQTTNVCGEHTTENSLTGQKMNVTIPPM